MWRTREDKSCNISVPLCGASPTPIPSQEQAVFVQDDVGIRMEVLCNGRVGDLLQSCLGERCYNC